MATEQIDIHDIIVRVQKLTNKEKMHILSILQANHHDYSKNANGYFFNLSTVNPDVLQNILECLQLIEQNRGLLKELDKRRDELLAYYRTIIEEKLRVSYEQKLEKTKDMLSIKPVECNISTTITKVIPAKFNTTDVDPDVLLQEYLKSKKYTKGTVYHSILSKMRSEKTNMKTFDGSKKCNDEYQFDGEYNEDEDVYVPEGIEEEYVSDVHEEVEDEYVSDVQSQLSNESVDTELSDHTECYSEHDDVPETTEQTTQLQNTMMYYRQLLNKKGFVFDKDMSCALVYQEYLT